MKRILSLLMVILLIIPMLVSGTSLHSYATQSRTDNFDLSGYTSTENAITNICAIAKLQNGKTGKDLGYTEEWCADFISDCAKLAKIKKLIPANGVVSELYTGVYKAGGTVIYEKGKVDKKPKKGDLAIIDWDSCGKDCHIELVYYVSGNYIKTIGGNTNGSTLSTRKVTVRPTGILYNDNRVRKIIRPNYEKKLVVELGMTSIGTIPYEHSHDITGSVRSPSELTSVRCEIRSGNTVIKEIEINPSGNYLDLKSSAINSGIKFGKLARGYYTLWIFAKNSSGTESLKKATFRIK